MVEKFKQFNGNQLVDVKPEWTGRRRRCSWRPAGRDRRTM